MSRPDFSSLDYMARRAQTFRRLTPGERRRHIERQRRRHQRDLPLLFELLVLLHGRRCAVCGCQYDLTIDHILPVSKGGRTVIENMQLLCRKHNQEKSDAIMDFREG